MNIRKIVAELKRKRKNLDDAIRALETMAAKADPGLAARSRRTSRSTRQRPIIEASSKSRVRGDERSAKIIPFRRLRSVRPRPAQVEEA